ncbi:GTPase IMAP family member 7-like [Carassius gibelio]|uniref:GTPase IMAP family member 7-like n=1 Tax=Carassius gibelio TaxID=101364 RepID=UPI0022774C9B|nr:GTPase IMAP family member 7-like [Carassius gibelio]XP_052458834.1 GTPase IMAP family member 7-like [Carassius gibelio]
MGSCVSMPERRIVLLGRKGDGKSSAGNTILGEKVFTPKVAGDSVKAICEIRKKSRYGSKITVIETPGFFDTDHDDKEIKSEIIKAMVECAQGVDAFVIVLKVGEYTSQEIKVLQQCLKTLKEDAFDHTVILFTFGEQLEDQTIEEFLKANSQLQKLVDKCGGRCQVIDNKYWKKRKRGNKSNKVQVKNLLESVAKIRHKNGCFTNELFQKIEKQIQEEIGKMGGENLPPEEKQEKAKKNVQEKILEKAAGMTTELLFGALLGVCGAVAIILAFLQTTFPSRALQNVASTVVRVVGGAVGGVVVGAFGGAREAETGVTDPEEAAMKTGEKAGGTSTETGEKSGEGGAGVLGVAAFAGAVGERVSGWNAGESVNAVIEAAQLNYEKATAVAENIQQYVGNLFNNRAKTED